jgi:hypothetical protein
MGDGLHQQKNENHVAELANLGELGDGIYGSTFKYARRAERMDLLVGKSS